MKRNDIGVVILAGGRSERMRFPKPFLVINGETLIESIIDNYAGLSSNIVVVLNHEWINEKYSSNIESIKTKAQIVINRHPEYGKFYSVLLGFIYIKKHSHYYIQQTDNPVSTETLLQLLNNKIKDGYIVPVFDGKGGHPILISDEIRSNMASLSGYNHNLKEFLEKFPRKNIETGDPDVLININIPADYKNYILQSL